MVFPSVGCGGRSYVFIEAICGGEKEAELVERVVIARSGRMICGCTVSFLREFLAKI